MLLRGMVMMSFVVLPKQVLAIIIAIGRSHDRVDVIAGRRLRPKRSHPTLVVELNKNHWTMDAVVKHTIRFSTANPGKIRSI